MIKVMTREQKLLLNDMVQSVLVHQQNNEETDIKITHERRKLALAQIRLTKAEEEKLNYEIELNKEIKKK